MWALENNKPKTALHLLKKNPDVVNQGSTRVTSIITNKLQIMTLSDDRKRLYGEINQFLSQGFE